MRNIQLLWILLALVLCLSAPASAHSTKDLKKITLQSEKLVVDQIAFYLEPYVNGRKDKDGNLFRYQIWEFKEIKHKGDMAEVHTLVNDQKTATRSPEVFYLKRNLDNTWNHVDAQGIVIAKKIYSYVNPDGSISSGGHTPIPGQMRGKSENTDDVRLMIAGVAFILVLVFFFMRRRNRARAA